MTLYSQREYFFLVVVVYHAITFDANNVTSLTIIDVVVVVGDCAPETEGWSIRYFWAVSRSCRCVI